MATLKPKAKSKKPGRPSKTDARNYDLSNLRPPFKTSISNLKEVVKLFEESTPEIKDLLTHEVNILYECRICGSIYRSLLNIVSHKRAFCKEKVNVTTEKRSRDDQSSNITLEDMQTLDLDESTFVTLDKPTKNARILRSQAPRKPQKKDLTSVVRMLQKKQEAHLGDEVKQKHTAVQRKKDDCDQVVLQVMESKLAAFQTLVEPNLSPVDLMENQVMELDSMSNQDTVTLGTDGLIEKSDSPVHFYNNDQDINKLICETCHRTFSTRKMLNSHMKTLHAPVRVTFMCPLCPQDNLGTPASVIRHLTNVHKKIGKELKELSERIEERIVKTKPIPTVSHKKTKKTGNPSKNTGRESQEWIERLEPQEFQDCSLCGERFGSKEDFMSHSENCIGQSDVRSPEEIEGINQDVLDDDEDCEVVSSVHGNFVAVTSPEEQKTDSSSNSEIIIQPRIQHISTLNLEDWNNLPQSFSQNEDCSNREITLLEKSNRPVITDSRILDDPEIVFSLDNARKRKASSLLEINGRSSQGERWKKAHRENEIAHLESGRRSAQNLEKKICQAKLECYPCKRSFTSLSTFKRHVDSHMKLNRYQCNKCDYKSVTRNDCIGHCNRMHNGMNNRQVLNEMISTIPQDQLNVSQEMDLTNLSSNDVSRSSSDAESRIRSMTPVTNLLQNQHNPINLSDTETETEDGDSARKIDLRPLKSDEILEIIGGSNPDPLDPKSNINMVNLSHIQNNNLEMSGQVFEYSPELVEINYNTNYPAEEDEISSELYPRSKSRMETRSLSRLGKKLDSDYEDEITPELSRAKSRNSIRSRSRAGTRSEPRFHTRVVTRSRSRIGNQSDTCVDIEENQDDIWKGYSRYFSPEESELRSRSRNGKEGNPTETRSLSRLSRGKRRGRPPGRGRHTRSLSQGRSYSRLGNQNDSYSDIEENQLDIWKGYSRDLSTGEPESRSLSRQSRGKRRGRPPGRGRHTGNISQERNCITPRSRSRLGNQSDSGSDIEMNQVDIWKGYSMNLSTGESESQSPPKPIRGKRRGRPPGRGKHTGSISQERNCITPRSHSRLGNQNDSYSDIEMNQLDIWKGYSTNLSTGELESRSVSRQSRGKRRGRPPGRGRHAGNVSQERNCITPRSRSRLGNQSDSGSDIEMNQVDVWKGCSRDLSSGEPESRSLSRQSRGKRRGRPPGRGRHTRSISQERSGYFSSQSPHMPRPARNRIKPIDKDFVYDMGDDDPFQRQLLSYSPRSNSGRKTPAFNQFVQDRLISQYAVTKRLFDETDDLEYIGEIPKQKPSSSSDVEIAEPYFKGFPQHAPIMNVE